METLQAVAYLSVGLLTLLGLAACFAGFLIYRFIVAVPGYLIGAALLGTLAYFASGQWWLAALAGLIGGSIGAWVALAWWKVKVVYVGVAFGLILDAALWAISGGDIEPVVLIAVPIVAGILAWMYEKWTLILATAFGGAGVAVIGIAWLATGGPGLGLFVALLEPGGDALKAVLGGWLVLGAVGVAVQRGWLTRSPRQPGGDEPGPGASGEGTAGPGPMPFGARSPAGQVPPQPAGPRIRAQALTGHHDSINAVVWDPRDRWIATGGDDGVVRLWDPRTGAPVMHLRGFSRDIHSLAVAPDGSWLAAADERKVMLWDTATGMVLPALDGPFKSAMAVHPRGDWLAVIAWDNSVQLYAPRTGRLIKRLEPAGMFFRKIDLLAVDKSGRWLATAGLDNLNLWDADAGHLRFRRSSLPFRDDVGEVRHLAMHPEARFLVHTSVNPDEIQITPVGDKQITRIRASSSFATSHIPIAISPTGRWIAAQPEWNNGLCILDAASGEILRRTESSYGIHDHLLFAPDESWVAVTRLKSLSVDIRNPETGELMRRLDQLKGWATAIGSSPDGTALACADRGGELEVLDIRSGRSRYRIQAVYRATKLTVSADSERVIVGSDDGFVHAWEPHRQRRKFHIQAHEYVGGEGVVSIASCPHSRWFVSAGSDGYVHFWSSATGEKLHSLERRINGGETTSIAVSKDGRWLATTDRPRHVVQFWDSSTGLHLGDWKTEAQWLWGLAADPEGRWAAVTVDTDYSGCHVCMIDPETTRTLARVRIDGGRSLLATIGDGRLIAATGGGLVYLIAPGTSFLNRIVARLPGHRGEIKSLVADPNGRWLASAGTEGVRISNIRKRKFWRELPLPDPRTHALAVDPQGRYLFTAGNDRLVRRWVLGDLSQEPVCDTAFEPLPDGEWVVWSDPDGPNRQWVNYSDGAKRWLGWHAPLPDGGPWGHRPIGTYTPPDRR